MNYIKLKDSKTFNGKCKVELWDFNQSNVSQESRLQAISFVAGTVYDRQTVNNPSERYKKLLVECNFQTPSRPFQFIPYILDLDGIKFDCDDFNDFIRFGYFQDGKLYTNMRNAISYYKKYEILEVPYSTIDKEYSDFVVFKLKIPIFVRDQIKTHTMVSSISQSHRVGNHSMADESISSDTYWLPEDIVTRVQPLRSLMDLPSNYTSNQILKSLSFSRGFLSSRKILKEIGYGKQIYLRFPNGLQYTTMLICGWRNDFKVWENFMLQRSDNDAHKHWTQQLTRQCANVMQELLKK